MHADVLGVEIETFTGGAQGGASVPPASAPWPLAPRWPTSAGRPPRASLRRTRQSAFYAPRLQRFDALYPRVKDLALTL